MNAFAEEGFDFAKLAAGMGGEMGDMDMGEAQKMFQEIMKQMGGLGGMEGAPDMTGMPGGMGPGMAPNDLFAGLLGGLGGEAGA